jgi:hypothetical protein
MLGVPMPEITYVGWGGHLAHVTADQPLGHGSRRGYPNYGIRRAAWDACFGFVNGFGIRAIAYYTITRSLNERFHLWVMRREGWTVRNGSVVSGSNPRFEREWAMFAEQLSASSEVTPAPIGDAEAESS